MKSFELPKIIPVFPLSNFIIFPNTFYYGDSLFYESLLKEIGQIIDDNQI